MDLLRRGAGRAAHPTAAGRRLRRAGLRAALCASLLAGCLLATSGLPAAALAAGRAGSPQASPPPTVPPFTGPALSIRMEGTPRPEVTQWQRRLAALGFAVSVDGDFGPHTEAATRAFQKAWALADTGTVDEAVWKAGFTAPVYGNPPLSTKEENTWLEAAVQWQNRMTALGYPLTADGGYGPKSAAATRTFQKAHHLPVTGVVDKATWVAGYTAALPASLTAAGASAPAWVAPPAAVIPGMAAGDWIASAAPVPPPVPAHSLTTAMANTWSGSVWAWQERMTHLGYPLSVDGYFGSDSQSVARSFAAAAHLTGSGELAGEVDATAWRAAFSDQSTGAEVDTKAGALGPLAVSLAQREQGAPYAWAGAGPDSFDCSGLVQFVFAQAGWSLPHNAEMQYEAVSHLATSELEPGDLVFFPDSSGTIEHVGIYAGTKDGEPMMWDAPQTGQTVQLQQIWTTDILAGRVA